MPLSQERIFIDIDGTITENSIYGDTETLLAFGQIMNGASIGIATARDYPGSSRIYSSILNKDLCIVENGSVIIEGDKVHYPVDIRETLTKIKKQLAKFPFLEINYFDSYRDGRCNSMSIKIKDESVTESVLKVCEKFSSIVLIHQTHGIIYLYSKDINKIKVLDFLASGYIYLVSNHEEYIELTDNVRMICVGNSKWHPNPLLTISKLGKNELQMIKAAIEADKNPTSYCSSEYAGITYHQKWFQQGTIYKPFVKQIYGYLLNGMTQVAIVKTKSGWQLPGGKPELNEEYVETLARELMEETNCSIVDPFLIGFIKVFGGDSRIPFLQLRYVCHLKMQHAKKLLYETDKLIFVEPKDLEKYFPWFKAPNYIDEFSCFLNSLHKR